MAAAAPLRHIPAASPVTAHAATPSGPLFALWESTFRTILNGYISNSLKASPTFAVCDFPDGTRLKSCMTPREQTYVSTARMMPPVGLWLKGGLPRKIETDAGIIDLLDLLVRAFTAAFDPAAREFWGMARTDKADQRQVEASLVAYTLWVVGEPLLSRLTPATRTNIQAWLAGCTVIPERRHNHAWFSAINQAVRLELARDWPEFKGDEEYMLLDLRALDEMAISDGWYNDWPDAEVYDWYNFWTYASHFLYWNAICGSRYPDIQKRFLPRLRQFLAQAPYFFAGHGGHVLFGRSLIYRWACLTPLVLSYQQGLWPHSPGLLRRILRVNMEWHWKLDPYDEQRGKLRETYSPQGNHAVTERYIDNGHPYWCMQAYALFQVPPNDPLWTAPEEPLPIEQRDFDLALPALGMRVIGHRKTGHVQWLQSRNIHKETYRDKYIKFSYSSHFPFCILTAKDRVPWDSTLLFVDTETGDVSARSRVIKGGLTKTGYATEWEAQIAGVRLRVVSEITIAGEFQRRRHIVRPLGQYTPGRILAREGTYPIPVPIGGTQPGRASGLYLLNNSLQPATIGALPLEGYLEVRTVSTFDEKHSPGTNILYPEVEVLTLEAPIMADEQVLEAVFFATPTAMGRKEVAEALTASGMLPPPTEDSH